ncbi:MAG TPA: AbrB/MazE/SpoVT family DNA-binding domain-containing protein [Thermomicrobiales bacterium]|nr:AbrB/MazE/SpoVT family DNA-binding domain-containing protein [Thermomicrobiales bacterium]
METTRLSSKGQVIIPKAVREARGWEPGTELVVEEHADGVLLRSRPAFAATRIDDVAGCLKRHGPPKSVREMDEAVAAEARRRWRKFEAQ